MRSREQRGKRTRIALVALGALLMALAVGAGLAYKYADWSPWALKRAQEVGSPRNRWLYWLLARRRPALEPYTRLWLAESELPDMEAVQSLHDLGEYLPDGPLALSAHVALARYYAGIESPQTVVQYEAALAIDDRADIRLELARYLETQAAARSAYSHYLQLLGPNRPDAFVGARRTAPNSTVLAQDLLRRGYLNDVVDVLYRVGGCEAYCLRAEAFQRLGRAAEASATAAMCAECSETRDATGSGDATPDTQAAATPLELWNKTWALEEAADYAALLSIYLDLATTGSVYADDAAYRALILSRRLEDSATEAKSLRLLAETQPSWLAYRVSGELPLCVRDDFPAEAVSDLTAGTMARVVALDELVLPELAHQELRLTALVSETPEVLQRMAQELLTRGYTTEAWSLASAYLRRDRCAPRAFWELAYPRPHEEAVQSAAQAEGVDEALLWAVMRQESAYQPEIVSWAGARGLMQIMPFTHEEYCEAGEAPCAPGSSFIPDYNIRMGAAHLRKGREYYDGDLELAVLAYNAGPGNVDQWLADPNVHDRDDLLRLAWFGETREYLQRVMLDRLVYQALYGATDSE